jgi:hypothetical protein
VVEGIIIGVISGVLVLFIAGLWKRRGSPRRWYQEQRKIASTAERADARQELDVLREQVLEVARARHIGLPASAKGTNPTIVVFSDGSTRFYFTDQASYLRAMQARQVPPTRSFRSKPPVPVSRWTRQDLEQWLAENRD